MRFLPPTGAFLVACVIPVILSAQAELFVHNYHQVDAHVSRGAQPGVDGLRALAANGVKTDLDLREPSERTGKEKKEAESLGLKYINIPMNGLRAPTAGEMEKALATLNDSSAWPVFVHCKYGDDRTGSVIACYRMQHDGWDNHKAFAEARRIGMHYWEVGMKTFILQFREGLPAAGNPSAEKQSR